VFGDGMASDVMVIKQRLIDLIESGQVPLQGQLPNERQLTVMMDTTRWPLRKALALLTAEGRIWRHVGRGTFVGPKPPAISENLALLCEYSSPTDLIEARILIEPSLAALAAVRAPPRLIAEIADAANKCQTARDMAAYEVWDETFHKAVAAAAGNVILQSTFDGINALRKEIAWGWMKKNELNRDRRQFFAIQHQSIVTAIKRRDPEGARKAMLTHIDSLKAIYARLENASMNSGIAEHLNNGRGRIGGGNVQ
jgi:DNA-binding FadR family transcriptional regulator